MSPLRAHIFHENEFSWWRDIDDAVNFDGPLGQISLSPIHRLQNIYTSAMSKGNVGIYSVFFVFVLTTNVQTKEFSCFSKRYKKILCMCVCVYVFCFENCCHLAIMVL